MSFDNNFIFIKFVDTGINFKYYNILSQNLLLRGEERYIRDKFYSDKDLRMVCHNAIIANLQFRIRYYDEVDVKRGKSGDLNQSYSRLGSFPKQDGRKTRDLSPRAVFDGGSDEPTILHLPSHVIDPLFSTLEAIILTGVNIYRETEREGGKSERWSGRGEGGVGRGRKSHANTSLRRPFGAADPPK